MKRKILLFMTAIALSMATAFAENHIILRAEPSQGGSVTGGGSNIPFGTEITVCATANMCYKFSHWSDIDGLILSSDSCYTFFFTKSGLLIANFVGSETSIVIEGATNICDFFTLSAVIEPEVPNATYTWYHYGVEIPDVFTPEITLDPTIPYHPWYFYHIFSVAINLESGCSVRSPEHIVSVVTSTPIEAFADKTDIFAGETVFLYQNSVGNCPGLYFQWFADGIPIPDANYYFCYVNPEKTTTYKLIAFATETICPSKESNEIIITVNDSVEIEGPDFVCGENPITLQAITAPELIIVTYQWYINGEAIAGANAPMLLISLEPSSIPYCFTVIVTDTSGSSFISPPHCVSTIIEINADKTDIFLGDVVMLSAKVTNLFNRIYSWFANGVLIPDSTEPIIYVTPTATTIYTFTATSLDLECVAESNEIAVAVFIAITADKTEIKAGETATLTAHVSTIPDDNYQWFANGNVIADANQPVIDVTPMVTTIYTFAATSDYRTITVSKELTITVIGEGISISDIESNGNIIFYPNPSDGQFTITSEKIIENFEMYDLLGKKVFEAAPKTKTTPISTNLQHGLYIYRAVFQDNSISSGKIIIE